MPVKFTKKEIMTVAHRTVELLEEEGYKCCVFGSVACCVWGMNRIPNDVDIVVFGQHHDPEKIKAYLENASDEFVLENARDPRDTYKVLHFNLPHKRCKVDILISGRHKPLHIPKIHKSHVIYRTNYKIPVVPFFVLVILKVQGWRDHRISKKPWHRRKLPQDNKDIVSLLGALKDGDHLNNFQWLPRWFIKRAEWLVGKYTDKHPDTASAFRDMGFDFLQ